MEIGEIIRNYRKDYKLTQSECARRAGVGLRFLKELEHGKQTVRLDKVNCVLALFGKKIGVENE